MIGCPSLAFPPLLHPTQQERASELQFPYEYDGDDETQTDVNIDLSYKCMSNETEDITSNHFICSDPRVTPTNYFDYRETQGMDHDKHEVRAAVCNLTSA